MSDLLFPWDLLLSLTETISQPDQKYLYKDQPNKESQDELVSPCYLQNNHKQSDLQKKPVLWLVSCDSYWALIGWYLFSHFSTTKNPLMIHYSKVKDNEAEIIYK